MAKGHGPAQVTSRPSAAPAARGSKIKIPHGTSHGAAQGTLKTPGSAPRSDPWGDLRRSALPANQEARCGCLETVSMAPRAAVPGRAWSKGEGPAGGGCSLGRHGNAGSCGRQARPPPGPSCRRRRGD